MKQSNHWSRSLTVLSLCAACVMAGVAWRSASARATEVEMLATAKPTAVAVVDFDKVFQNSKEYTDGMEFLETQKKEAQSKVDELKVKFEKLKTDLEATKEGLMLDRLKTMQDALVVQAQLEALIGTSQQILEVQAGDLMRQVFEKTVKAAEKLQKQDGWDMVLLDDRKIVPPERLPDPKTGKEGAGGRPTSGEVHSIIQRRHILSAVERVDITQTIIDFMNAEYGKSPSPASTKPGATKK